MFLPVVLGKASWQVHRYRLPATATLVVQGDVDANGAVNFEDILLVLNAWGPCGDPSPKTLTRRHCWFSEILLILTAFGDCPLPPPPLDRTGSCCLSDGSCARHFCG